MDLAVQGRLDRLVAARVREVQVLDAVLLADAHAVQTAVELLAPRGHDLALGREHENGLFGVGVGVDAALLVDDHRAVHNSACTGDGDLSQYFSYRCEGLGSNKACFWELNKLIRLDTEALNQGVGPLVGKVGIANYNHRLLSTAVNVVGTGVLDCAKDPRSSCYGSGYLEYDLDHSAFRIPIDDYEGAVRCFDFGNGTIRGAKALASERYITTPLSGADAQLIQQAAFTKQELSGRPLSGQYRFRIKDTPALQWSNVEDVQLMLSYRYWARVGRAQK